MANPNLAAEGKRFQFKKGKSGNPHGYNGLFSKDQAEAQRQLMAIGRKVLMSKTTGEGGEERTMAESIFETMAFKAQEGDAQAAHFVYEWSFGKLRQDVGLTGGMTLAAFLDSSAKQVSEAEGEIRKVQEDTREG